jgi:hypothetical protein
VIHLYFYLDTKIIMAGIFIRCLWILKRCKKWLLNNYEKPISKKSEYEFQWKLKESEITYCVEDTIYFLFIKQSLLDKAKCRLFLN